MRMVSVSTWCTASKGPASAAVPESGTLRQSEKDQIHQQKKNKGKPFFHQQVVRVRAEIIQYGKGAGFMRHNI